MSNPSISLDLTKSGIGDVVVCERRNYQGTATGPIANDTEILVGLTGVVVTVTFSQLIDLITRVADETTKLPEKRRRDYSYWSEVRARQAASA